jgi:WhiB family redox-sensing transcriptional regulator
MKEFEIPSEFEITRRNGKKEKITFTGNIHDNEWANKANCASEHPDLVFVESAPTQEKNINTICRRNNKPCPVQLPCVVESLRSGDHFGIWGGLSERDRRVFAKEHGQYILDLIADEEAAIVEQNTYPEQYATLSVPLRTVAQHLLGLEADTQQAS